MESGCPTGDTFPIGRMTHYNDPSGSTLFCFDRFGNLAHKTQAVTNTTLNEADHNFDKMGRPMESIEPFNMELNYTRNGIGRITAINYSSTAAEHEPLITNVTYYPFGPVASITYGDGRVLNRITRPGLRHPAA